MHVGTSDNPRARHVKISRPRLARPCEYERASCGGAAHKDEGSAARGATLRSRRSRVMDSFPACCGRVGVWVSRGQCAAIEKTEAQERARLPIKRCRQRWRVCGKRGLSSGWLPADCCSQASGCHPGAQAQPRVSVASELSPGGGGRVGPVGAVWASGGTPPPRVRRAVRLSRTSRLLHRSTRAAPRGERAAAVIVPG